MCGIAGFLAPSGLDPDASAAVERMTRSIAHRGPDGAGHWLDKSAGVALGHRRLAIIDLSEAGAQPMTSASGRYVLVYNGELYNTQELCRELEDAGAAPNWRGHSDTEVLLAALDRWGLSETLTKLNGMFALALWDRANRTLALARDRMGEKPLYYGVVSGRFLFGSELKALQAHPAFEAEIDRCALTALMRLNYVPGPRSIWKGIWKLPPANYLVVTPGVSELPDPVPYWRLDQVALAGVSGSFPDTPELVDEVEALLRDAVGRRMSADVPLGAFLSGGIDSSVVTALMQIQSDRPVRSFSIGFHDRSYDEAQHAKAVANHLGTDHTELYVTPDQALALVPRLPRVWDEPFSDSSQIPTLLLSELTRRHVTVALSGDGGDELFGGYNRYVMGAQLWERAARFPFGVRSIVGRVARSGAASSAAAAIAGLVPSRFRHAGVADRLPKLAQVVEARSPADVYRGLVSHWHEPERLVRSGEEAAAASIPDLGDPRHSMMFNDAIGYLPDDILAKVDRASMAASLEARVPFLDHRVVELAWRLPLSAKIRDGRGKRIIREILDRHVPRALIERPKMGFAVPLNSWLLGPLRPWAEGLLARRRIEEEGFFDADVVALAWQELKDGAKGRTTQIWSVLMFQAWLEEQRAGREHA